MTGIAILYEGEASDVDCRKTARDSLVTDAIRFEEAATEVLAHHAEEWRSYKRLTIPRDRVGPVARGGDLDIMEAEIQVTTPPQRNERRSAPAGQEDRRPLRKLSKGRHAHPVGLEGNGSWYSKQRRGG